MQAIYIILVVYATFLHLCIIQISIAFGDLDFHSLGLLITIEEYKSNWRHIEVCSFQTIWSQGCVSAWTLSIIDRLCVQTNAMVCLKVSEREYTNILNQLKMRYFLSANLKFVITMLKRLGLWNIYALLLIQSVEILVNWHVPTSPINYWQHYQLISAAAWRNPMSLDENLQCKSKFQYLINLQFTISGVFTLSITHKVLLKHGKIELCADSEDTWPDTWCNSRQDSIYKPLMNWTVWDLTGHKDSISTSTILSKLLMGPHKTSDQLLMKHLLNLLVL